jgi:mRNA-degrading endonuclease RelE of RelBE toxin-antitoxin system
LKNNGDTVNYSAGGGEVKIIQDARLDKIGAFLRTGEGTVEGVKIDGYRVLIFFDQDKSLAEQRKAAFMSGYPDHRTYVDYVAPNYRVRVGNFRTRLEAESLKAVLLVEYPTAIVVADKIDLPVLEPKVNK